MKKHQFNTEKQDKLLENLDFSKDFFEIMDEDGTNSIIL